MTSWVYFLRAAGDGPVKIGYTARDPRKRKAELQVLCPYPVKLLGAVPGDRRDERRLQAPHLAHRLHGDWFCPHASVLEAIDCCLSAPDAWRPPVWAPKRSHRLCRYRAAHGLTQAALGERVGVQASHISMIEMRRKSPSLGLAIRLSGATGLEPDIFVLTGAAS